MHSRWPKPWFKCSSEYVLIDVEPRGTQLREHILHIDHAALGRKPKYTNGSGYSHAESFSHSSPSRFINQYQVRLDFHRECDRCAFSFIEVRRHSGQRFRSRRLQVQPIWSAFHYEAD